MPSRSLRQDRPALEELAATAGYQVEPTGQLPLLRYVLAIHPGPEAKP